jgi:hypothetical protein
MKKICMTLIKEFNSQNLLYKILKSSFIHKKRIKKIESFEIKVLFIIYLYIFKFIYIYIYNNKNKL